MLEAVFVMCRCFRRMGHCNFHWFSCMATGPFFVLQDFLQWDADCHANEWLWRFQIIIPSRMGVAAHFRYHWMENVRMSLTCRSGFVCRCGSQMVLVWGTVDGHLNHANIRLDWGPLRYLFNSPTLHLLHHSQSHSTLWAICYFTQTRIASWYVC